MGREDPRKSIVKGQDGRDHTATDIREWWVGTTCRMESLAKEWKTAVAVQLTDEEKEKRRSTSWRKWIDFPGFLKKCEWIFMYCKLHTVYWVYPGPCTHCEKKSLTCRIKVVYSEIWMERKYSNWKLPSLQVFELFILYTSKR